jgi:hypothetical protein
MATRARLPAGRVPGAGTAGWSEGGEEFLSNHRSKKGKEFVVVTRPDGLASSDMTRAMHGQEYRANPLRLTAESLELFKEVADLQYRRLQDMKLDGDHTLLH